MGHRVYEHWWCSRDNGPEPEQSLEKIPDEVSQPFYREEEPLSEASNTSLPPRRRHWMDTRLRTRMRAGGSGLDYQHFDFSADTNDELSNILLPSAQVETNDGMDLAIPPEGPTAPLPNCHHPRHPTKIFYSLNMSWWRLNPVHRILRPNLQPPEQRLPSLVLRSHYWSIPL